MSNAYLDDDHNHEWQIVMPANGKRLWLEAWCHGCDDVLMIDEIHRRLNVKEEIEDGS